MLAANCPTSKLFRRRGFTLTELLIAVAMVLILMAGIVKVFSYATNSISAGMAVSDIIRAQRVLDTGLPADTAGLTTDVTRCPAILLDSQQNDSTVAQPNGNTINNIVGNGDYGVMQGPLFLSKADQAALTANSGGLSAQQLQAAEQYRQDTFSFFSRGNFTRRTGNDGTFVSPLTSTWAWIWYGQLWLPDNSANFRPVSAADTLSTYPGGGTSSSNPNNFYAQQWQLGREVILILPKNVNSPTGGVAITDIAPGVWPGTPTATTSGKLFQSFVDELPNPLTIPANTSSLSPLAFESAAYDYNRNIYVQYQDAFSGSYGQSNPEVTPAPIYQIQQSRYDLAGVTASSTGDPFIDYFDPRLNNIPLNTAYVPNWTYPVIPQNSTNLLSSASRSLNYRFQANPYPVRPLTSAASAQTVPPLIVGCARIYVEYAGDFINQNANGTNTSATNATKWNFTQTGYQPDGTDFYVDPSGVRHIRWYGLARSATGSQYLDTNILGATAGGITYETGDVLPLAFYLSQSVTNPTTRAIFERLVSALVGGPPFSTANPASNHYICAWDATASGNANYCQRPTMFRITIELADPGSRLQSTRVLQYLIPVQQQ